MSSSVFSGSSSSSLENTGQSASPSATSAKKDDSGAEAEEEDEPESSNYHVTSEEPQVVSAQLHPVENKADQRETDPLLGTDEWRS
jgi:hypothetical protein